MRVARSAHPGSAARFAMASCMLVGTFLLLAGSSMADDRYEPADAITEPDITNPVPNEVWLAGSDHSLTAFAYDCDWDTWEQEAVTDSVTFTWSGTGTFWNSDNVGNPVTYLCTNSESNNTVSVSADDDYSGPLAPDDVALAPEDATETIDETVSVIVPEPDELTFLDCDESGGAKHDKISDASAPEWTRNPSKSHPAAYTRSTSTTSKYTKVAVKFWDSSSLTEDSTVDVFGAGSGDAPFLGLYSTDSGEAWSSWPTSSTTHTADTALPLSVSISTGSIGWYYRVPSGTNEWIDMGDTGTHKIYVVFATPVQPEDAAVFELSCQYTGRGDGSDGEDICDDILLGMGGDYTYNGFLCHRLSSNFVRLVGVQGVSATQHSWCVEPAGQFEDGDIIKMKSISFVPLGKEDPEVFEWSLHQWADYGGYQWDIAGDTKHSGTWMDYEDTIIADYKEKWSFPYSPSWHGSNWAGQLTEVDKEMEHSSSPELWQFYPVPE